MMIRLRTSAAAIAVAVTMAAPVAAQDAAIPLGTPMPGQNLELKDVSGATTSLAQHRGETLTAVVFWGNKCPWTARYEDRIKVLANELEGEDKVLVLINSNDASAFPAESVQESADYIREAGLPYTYLLDSKSELARAFGASRMPQVYLFDAAGTLVYTGAIDDSPGDPDNVTRDYLKDAIAAVSASKSVAVAETKAFGCMIRPVRP